ncbi:MAG: FUSC family protein [Edaphobacter sp.]|uniref:FUSC family protein n=1 Tax=Edaphobacter sp. TaxID=1934404 RepID=UPI0023892FE0|nr:FUSC family protein [Edaphobacter sp.]MDE1174982.1 FUSC family protein [Edaphobacter sp.]
MAPHPGRLSGSLRDTLAISIIIVISMTLRVQGVSLALALLYLMQRERPGLTFRVGLQILAGAAAACAMSFFWVQLTDGTEVFRFLGVMSCIFVSAFCMAGTTIPLFWTILAFYGFVDLAGWDTHRSADAIVTSTLYNVAALAIVVLCAGAVEYVFGTRHPAEDLSREMRKRISSLQSFLTALAESTSTPDAEVARHHRSLIQYAHAGDLYLNELYDRLRDATPDPSQLPLGLHYRIGLVGRMLNTCIVFGFRLPQSSTEEQREAYRIVASLCDDLLHVRPLPQELFLPNETPEPLREIGQELLEFGTIESPTTQAAEKPSRRPSASLSWNIFLPGVFDSPATIFYALKLTLAATICYLIYNAFAWPGILTCVVTVLFTGLSSTGAMKQKQLYRFSGAAIGGLLAILVVSLFYPNMDSITSLVIVVAPVAFLAGWVLRSQQMSYIGVQIGFGFFLTALPGFSAATQITPARDRVIGVGLGILVMWFIFDQLWPIRTTDALHSSLNRIRHATEELFQLLSKPEAERDPGAFQRLRSAVSLELVNVHQLGFSANFEVGRHRKRELARTRRLISKIEHSSAEFYSAAMQGYRS